ncbi:hypothetical protein QRX50_44365 [Amycolatopsis carbonis]|uniref:Uncharacterized protein n=1 Tax=Amycolatopsis carbonis TaxID=715471 RepID=A0A9Y2MTZ5_9PSEU|nr:hypothetical protein [Amycolatopsis sp. 2-15]WIX78326.1 hypothetical protein QRX50_44365 [Amycolatopsis sp. 2-15]
MRMSPSQAEFTARRRRVGTRVLRFGRPGRRRDVVPRSGAAPLALPEHGKTQEQ